MSYEPPAAWLVAAAVAIGNGTAEPEHLEAARRVLQVLRREGALRRLDPTSHAQELS